MRRFAVLLLAVSAALPAHAQEIRRVRLGFQDINDPAVDQFKLVLWLPVHIEIKAGPEGISKESVPHIDVEAFDSEGVSTVYRVELDNMAANETRHVLAYTKPGGAMNPGDVRVSLHIGTQTFMGPTSPGIAGQPQLNNHLVLCLGAKIPDLADAFALLNPRGQVSNARVGAFETETPRLPDRWFGYQGVDMIFLSTTNAAFLTELRKDSPRLKALAQWIARGGRLVIAVDRKTQGPLAEMLKAPEWQPAVRFHPPADPGDARAFSVPRLLAIENWVGIAGKPFQTSGKIEIARLDPPSIPAGAWDVLAATPDNQSLIARLPYGLGQITFLAFPLDAGPFLKWDGRADFLKKAILAIGSRVNPNIHEGKSGAGSSGDGNVPDITSELQKTLENVNVDVVPFGYVALLIILYIVVIGPLDYVVLKHVFHRLQWTWITFPLVVVGVSVAAYYTVYALKGTELKVNKIDVIDFDLRTALNEQNRTQAAYAYGQSFIALFTPETQKYTIGVEPTAWQPKALSGKLLRNADMVTWLGRPDLNGPGGLRQASGQGFFQRPYDYARDAKGLINVPIPVWSTRTFTASWQAELPALPFDADLTFHSRDRAGQDLKVSGTIGNNLPTALEDVYLAYGDRCYFLAKNWPASSQAGSKPLKVAITSQQTAAFETFLRAGEVQTPAETRPDRATYDPTGLVKWAMFFEHSEKGGAHRNHSLRPLDLSWRLKPEIRFHDTSRRDVLREAILYARVPFEAGSAKNVNEGVASPTRLWLGALPNQTGDSPSDPPALIGTMAQDTYVRVLLPIRAAD